MIEMWFVVNKLMLVNTCVFDVIRAEMTSRNFVVHQGNIRKLYFMFTVRSR